MREFGKREIGSGSTPDSETSLSGGSGGCCLLQRDTRRAEKKQEEEKTGFAHENQSIGRMIRSHRKL